MGFVNLPLMWSVSVLVLVLVVVVVVRFRFGYCSKRFGSFEGGSRPLWSP